VRVQGGKRTLLDTREVEVRSVQDKGIQVKCCQQVRVLGSSQAWQGIEQFVCALSNDVSWKLFRPTVPVKNHAKVWWKYARKAVSVQKNRNFSSWMFVQDVVRKRNAYFGLMERVANDPIYQLTPGDSEFCRIFEESFPREAFKVYLNDVSEDAKTDESNRFSLENADDDAVQESINLFALNIGKKLAYTIQNCFEREDWFRLNDCRTLRIKFLDSISLYNESNTFEFNLCKVETFISLEKYEVEAELGIENIELVQSNSTKSLLSESNSSSHLINAYFKKSILEKIVRVDLNRRIYLNSSIDVNNLWRQLTNYSSSNFIDDLYFFQLETQSIDWSNMFSNISMLNRLEQVLIEKKRNQFIIFIQKFESFHAPYEGGDSISLKVPEMYLERSKHENISFDVITPKIALEISHPFHILDLLSYYNSTKDFIVSFNVISESVAIRHFYSESALVYNALNCMFTFRSSSISGHLIQGKSLKIYMQEPYLDDLESFCAINDFTLSSLLSFECSLMDLNSNFIFPWSSSAYLPIMLSQWSIECLFKISTLRISASQLITFHKVEGSVSESSLFNQKDKLYIKCTYEMLLVTELKEDSNISELPLHSLEQGRVNIAFSKFQSDPEVSFLFWNNKASIKAANILLECNECIARFIDQSGFKREDITFQFNNLDTYLESDSKKVEIAVQNFEFSLNANTFVLSASNEVVLTMLDSDLVFNLKRALSDLTLKLIYEKVSDYAKISLFIDAFECENEIDFAYWISTINYELNSAWRAELKFNSIRFSKSKVHCDDFFQLSASSISCFVEKDSYQNVRMKSGSIQRLKGDFVGKTANQSKTAFDFENLVMSFKDQFEVSLNEVMIHSKILQWISVFHQYLGSTQVSYNLTFRNCAVVFENEICESLAVVMLWADYFFLKLGDEESNLELENFYAIEFTPKNQDFNTFSNIPNLYQQTQKVRLNDPLDIHLKKTYEILELSLSDPLFFRISSRVFWFFERHFSIEKLVQVFNNLHLYNTHISVSNFVLIICDELNRSLLSFLLSSFSIESSSKSQTLALSFSIQVQCYCLYGNTWDTLIEPNICMMAIEYFNDNCTQARISFSNSFNLILSQSFLEILESLRAVSNVTRRVRIMNSSGESILLLFKENDIEKDILLEDSCDQDITNIVFGSSEQLLFSALVSNLFIFSNLRLSNRSFSKNVINLPQKRDFALGLKLQKSKSDIVYAIQSDVEIVNRTIYNLQFKSTFHEWVVKANSTEAVPIQSCRCGIKFKPFFEKNMEAFSFSDELFTICSNERKYLTIRVNDSSGGCAEFILEYIELDSLYKLQINPCLSFLNSSSFKIYLKVFASEHMHGISWRSKSDVTGSVELIELAPDAEFNSCKPCEFLTFWISLTGLEWVCKCFNREFENDHFFLHDTNSSSMSQQKYCFALRNIRFSEATFKNCWKLEISVPQLVLNESKLSLLLKFRDSDETEEVLSFNKDGEIAMPITDRFNLGVLNEEGRMTWSNEVILDFAVRSCSVFVPAYPSQNASVQYFLAQLELTEGPRDNSRLINLRPGIIFFNNSAEDFVIRESHTKSKGVPIKSGAVLENMYWESFDLQPYFEISSLSCNGSWSCIFDYKFKGSYNFFLKRESEKESPNEPISFYKIEISLTSMFRTRVDIFDDCAPFVFRNVSNFEISLFQIGGNYNFKLKPSESIPFSWENVMLEKIVVVKADSLSNQVSDVVKVDLSALQIMNLIEIDLPNKIGVLKCNFLTLSNACSQIQIDVQAFSANQLESLNELLSNGKQETEKLVKGITLQELKLSDLASNLKVIYFTLQIADFQKSWDPVESSVLINQSLSKFIEVDNSKIAAVSTVYIRAFSDSSYIQVLGEVELPWESIIPEKPFWIHFMIREHDTLIPSGISACFRYGQMGNEGQISERSRARSISAARNYRRRVLTDSKESQISLGTFEFVVSALCFLRINQYSTYFCDLEYNGVHYLSKRVTGSYPIWNEAFQLDYFEGKKLVITLFAFHDDFEHLMGSIIVDPAKFSYLSEHVPQRKWISLQRKKALSKNLLDECSTSLLLSFEWIKLSYKNPSPLCLSLWIPNIQVSIVSRLEKGSIERAEIASINLCNFVYDQRLLNNKKTAFFVTFDRLYAISESKLIIDSAWSSSDSPASVFQFSSVIDYESSIVQYLGINLQEVTFFLENFQGQFVLYLLKCFNFEIKMAKQYFQYLNNYDIQEFSLGGFKISFKKLPENDFDIHLKNSEISVLESIFSNSAISFDLIHGEYLKMNLSKVLSFSSFHWAMRLHQWLTYNHSSKQNSLDFYDKSYFGENQYQISVVLREPAAVLIRNPFINQVEGGLVWDGCGFENVFPKGIRTSMLLRENLDWDESKEEESISLIAGARNVKNKGIQLGKDMYHMLRKVSAARPALTDTDDFKNKHVRYFLATTIGSITSMQEVSGTEVIPLKKSDRIPRGFHIREIRSIDRFSALVYRFLNSASEQHLCSAQIESKKIVACTNKRLVFISISSKDKLSITWSCPLLCFLRLPYLENELLKLSYFHITETKFKKKTFSIEKQFYESTLYFIEDVEKVFKEAELNPSSSDFDFLSSAFLIDLESRKDIKEKLKLLNDMIIKFIDEENPTIQNLQTYINELCQLSKVSGLTETFRHRYGAFLKGFKSFQSWQFKYRFIRYIIDHFEELERLRLRDELEEVEKSFKKSLRIESPLRLISRLADLGEEKGANELKQNSLNEGHGKKTVDLMSKFSFPQIITTDNQVLKIRILSAEILSKISSPYDIYCLMIVEGSHINKKTEICRKSLNPGWDEVFELETNLMNPDSVVKFKLMHKNMISSGKIGSIRLSLSELIEIKEQNSVAKLKCFASRSSKQLVALLSISVLKDENELFLMSDDKASPTDRFRNISLSAVKEDLLLHSSSKSEEKQNEVISFDRSTSDDNTKQSEGQNFASVLE
jgi:hypothetical protein